jgi:curved DNA-binding protein
MAVRYQDYYQTLGVDRGASEKELQRAYRKLAREFHPDVNKTPGAEERFKQINEAYEVLSDPEKRKKYDRLGANWQAGQEFTPPPGFEGAPFGFGGDFRRGGFEQGPFEFGGDDFGGFSSFFEALFGQQAGRRTRTQGARARRGRSQEAEIELSLEDLLSERTREIALQAVEHGGDGRPQPVERRYEVRIPPGTTEGTVIRLAGQGSPGAAGGPSGDLLLRVKLAEHPRFRVDGFDLSTRVEIAPWEAALGAKIEVPLLSGGATLTVPAGSSSGRKLRLRGQGLPHRDGTRGDLIVELAIVVPAEPTSRERELYEELRRSSPFRPRGPGIDSR